jgi:hypothetical protein
LIQINSFDSYNATRGNSRSVWVSLRHSKSWAWTEHPSSVKLVGDLQHKFCGRNPRFYTSEEVIHSVGSTSGKHRWMFVYRKFGVYWLELAQCAFAFQKVKFGLWGSYKFEFRPIE